MAPLSARLNREVFNLPNTADSFDKLCKLVEKAFSFDLLFFKLASKQTDGEVSTFGRRFLVFFLFEVRLFDIVSNSLHNLGVRGLSHSLSHSEVQCPTSVGLLQASLIGGRVVLCGWRCKFVDVSRIPPLIGTCRVGAIQIQASGTVASPMACILASPSQELSCTLTFRQGGG